MTENQGVTFLWKIENFSFCRHLRFDAYLASPLFYVGILNGSAWELRIHPYRFGDDGRVKVYLHNISSREKLFIDYEISFLSADRSVLFADKEMNKRVKPEETSYEVSTYPTVHKIFESGKEEFLQQDTLIVQCRIWESNKRLFYSLQFNARSCIGIEQRTFYWPVKTFSNLSLFNQKRTHRIRAHEDEPTFCVEIFLKANTGDNQVFVCFHIKQISDCLSKKFVKCKISILNAEGNVVKSKEGSHWYTSQNNIWHFPQFLTKNELTENCLVDDVLHVVYDLTFRTDVDQCVLESVSSLPSYIQAKYVSNPGKNNVQQSDHELDEKGSNSILQEDLSALYRSKNLSDLEIRTEGKSFPVHKCILVARSPVFKAMFLTNMNGEMDNSLDLPDIDAETLDQLLLFVYTGNIAHLNYKSACKLYNAADKYELSSLKQKCSSLLASSITTDNACETLLLADRYHNEMLKSAVHSYIIRNEDKIIHSPEWLTFMKRDTRLASETMYMMLLKKTGNVT